MKFLNVSTRCFGVLVLALTAGASFPPVLHGFCFSRSYLSYPPATGSEPLCTQVTQSKWSPWYRHFGNDQAGAEASFNAGFTRRAEECQAEACGPEGPGQYLFPQYSRAAITGRAVGKLFNNRFELFDASGDAEISADGSNRVAARIKIGPYTLFSASGPATISASASKNVTFFKVSYTVSVAGIPVTITGSLGAGFSASLSLVASSSTQALGTVSGWAQGTATAGVGVPCVRAYLKASLKVLETGISGNVMAGYGSASGAVDLWIRPLSVKLAACVELCPFGSECKTLASWSTPAETIPLFRL